MVRRSINTIEAHNAGMPIRIIFVPNIPGSTMQQKKKYCMEKLDWLRRVLMYEPRGSDNSYGIVVTSPASKEAHFGAVYIDPTGWHDMCGHATMGFSSIAVQLGLIEISEPVTEVRLDTPAGLVKVNVYISHGKVTRVSMINVPSFIHSVEDIKLESRGEIEAYIAFGGNFYAIVELGELGIKWDKARLGELVEIARNIWEKIDESRIIHPEAPDIRGLYGVRFVEEISTDPYRAYGILIFGSRQKPLIDRSPSGTGTSAHLAYLYYKGVLKIGNEGEFYSAIDTVFIGKILGETKAGSYRAIIPEVSTKDKGGYITGYATWVIEDDDPLGEGFTL